MQVLPCSLSVTTYHLFQLTECSTVFLHLSWMASKSQAQYSALFKVSIALLVIFIIRCIINAGIVWHVCTRLLDLQLWDVRVYFSCRDCLLLVRCDMHSSIGLYALHWMLTWWWLCYPSAFYGMGLYCSKSVQSVLGVVSQCSQILCSEFNLQVAQV